MKKGCLARLLIEDLAGTINGSNPMKIIGLIENDWRWTIIQYERELTSWRN